MKAICVHGSRLLTKLKGNHFSIHRFALVARTILGIVLELKMKDMQ